MTWHENGSEVVRSRPAPSWLKRDAAFRGWRWPSGRVYATDLQVLRGERPCPSP